jgi:acyl carrier protein
MNKEEFIAAFAEQFDDTDASDIKSETKFQELEDWSSLTAMSVIAMVRTQFNKAITTKEIRSCETVDDLFNLVSAK